VAEVPAFAKRAADWQKQVGEGSAFAHWGTYRLPARPPRSGPPPRV